MMLQKNNKNEINRENHKIRKNLMEYAKECTYNQDCEEKAQWITI